MNRIAAAGPLTLLEQLNNSLRKGELEDEKYLALVGHGWGHTRGADYIYGQAGEDIVYALLDFASGHKAKEEVLSIVKRNIAQALRDNEPFRGLRGEEGATHALWMNLMDKGRAAGEKKAGLMMSGAVKALYYAQHRIATLGRDLEKQMIVLSDNLQSPVYAENKNAVILNVYSTKDVLENLIKAASDLKSDLDGIHAAVDKIKEASNKTATSGNFQQWKTMSRYDSELKNILDRAWELNVERETIQALNDGTVRGTRIVDSDFVAMLKGYIDSWHNKYGSRKTAGAGLSDKQIGERTRSGLMRLMSDIIHKYPSSASLRYGNRELSGTVEGHFVKIYYEILRASNGEVAGMPVIVLDGQKYGRFHGDAVEKLAELIESSRKPVSASARTASVREGDVCLVDITARGIYSPDTAGLHQLRILRDTVRQGDGYVDVDKIVGDNAVVSAHGNPVSKMVGGVSVPVWALRKVTNANKEAVANELVKVAELLAEKTEG